MYKTGKWTPLPLMRSVLSLSLSLIIDIYVVVIDIYTYIERQRIFFFLLGILT